MIAHISECHIISLQERQAGIIIFKVKRIPHSGRHLVNKTKYTFIPAGTVFIHKTGTEFHPKLFICIFPDLQLPLLAIRLFDQKQKLFIF